MDLAELERLGLYDPTATDAAQQRAMLEYVLAAGATVEEMGAAARENRLPFVLGDRLISPGRPHLTLEQASERVGLSVDTISRCWRAAGFPAPTAGVGLFADADVLVLDLLSTAIDAFGEDATLQIARVIGSSLARIAEAGFTAALINMEGGYLPRAESLVAAAQASERLGVMASSVSIVFDVVFRRHVEVAVRRWDANPSEDPATIQLAVGFADLVGFTSLSHQLSAPELSRAVTDLEAIAADAATARGGRLVKLVGDQIMYVAPDAQAGCDIALAVLAEVDEHSLLPPLRASLACGAVVPHEGDYFGPVVNLAARLVDAARAGELLVTEEVSRVLDGRYAASPVAAMSFKGFPEAIKAVAIRAVRA
jgi:class 3 adenylate cyclase